MKKLFFFILFTSFALSQSNNIVRNLPSQITIKDTLTNTKDTAIYSFLSSGWSYHGITAYCPSGTDSLTVYKQAFDNITWTQVKLIDELNTSTSEVSTIPVTTTAKGYIPFNTGKNKIMIISSSNDASTTVIITDIK